MYDAGLWPQDYGSIRMYVCTCNWGACSAGGAVSLQSVCLMLKSYVLMGVYTVMLDWAWQFLYHILVAYSEFFVLGIKSVRSLGCLLYSLYS